jgi:hypothetical protein
MLRRGELPTARSEGRGGFRSSRRFCCTPCRGLWWSKEWISMRTRGGGGEVTVDGEAPTANVGRGPAHELQWDMGMVVVLSIGSIHFGLGVTDEDSGGGGGDGCRWASGERCRALETPRSGRRASRWWCSAGQEVVVARECSEWAAHGESKAAAELEVAGAMEDEARAQEGEIDRAREHQWVTVVLEQLWIGV